MAAAALTLVRYLEESAVRFPGRTAVVDPYGQSLTYAQLNDGANRAAAFLQQHGVQPGDRVGVILRKSAAAVTALWGIMKAGAVYVPADYSAPAERNSQILTDCEVRVAFLDVSCAEVAAAGRGRFQTVMVQHPDSTADVAEGCHRWAEVLATGTPHAPVASGPEDLAYILYTSGSTGVPKGVMLTHENATSFVEWCSSAFVPTEHDRFSSHAPFHFDLSVLDIYVSLKHGATLYLVSEQLGKSPRELAQFIGDNRLTVWYSTPSILALLTQFGNLQSVDCSPLRLVLFAGEVFPVKHLRALKRVWARPVYYNLYGPTETNVCTFARIPEFVPDDRTEPYPIGAACSHCLPLVLDQGREVTPGKEGGLHISGPSVFPGYWNRPVENAAAFIERDGVRWYNTGDVVRDAGDQGFLYLGRRDRMVKRHGYRIELGEIESALYRHLQVLEAAVIAVDDASGVKIIANLTVRGTERPSIIALKVFCAAQLPAYMSPDVFVFHDALPRTSTDKIDYQRLKAAVVSAPAAR